MSELSDKQVYMYKQNICPGVHASPWKSEMEEKEEEEEEKKTMRA